MSQAFTLHKRLMRLAFQAWLDRFDLRPAPDCWQIAAAHQRPSHVWNHANGLSRGRPIVSQPCSSPCTTLTGPWIMAARSYRNVRGAKRH